VVQVIYGDKWMPALPTLYVFAAAISVGFLVPIINGALDAIGQPRVMMRLGVYWVIINWIAVTTVMQFRNDPLSFSLAYCVHILFGNLAAIFAVKKLLPSARLWPRMRAATGSAVAAAIVARWVLLPWTKGPITLTAAVLTTIAVFGGAVMLLDRSVLVELRALVQKNRKSAKSGN
jgi:hypothetical protein